jgi:hypothetical protein
MPALQLDADATNITSALLPVAVISGYGLDTANRGSRSGRASKG